jgi:hypothetical protein
MKGQRKHEEFIDDASGDLSRRGFITWSVAAGLGAFNRSALGAELPRLDQAPRPVQGGIVSAMKGETNHPYNP